MRRVHKNVLIPDFAAWEIGAKSWPAQSATLAVLPAINDAFLVGPECTLDVEYGMVVENFIHQEQLLQIVWRCAALVVRALSLATALPSGELDFCLLAR